MHSDRYQGPLLVLLAHPDDEFALFAWIRSAITQQRETIAVWLTDGGWGGQDIARRQAESTSVLESLGLDRSHLHFIGAECSIPDGSLHMHLSQIVPQLLARFGGEVVGGEVMIPAWEGGHPDHDAAHVAGIHLGLARGAFLTQYPMYHGAGLRGPFFRLMSPLPANGPVERIATTVVERMFYAALCLRYRSQWKSFLGLLPVYVWRMRQRNAFLRQLVDATRIEGPPHVTPLLYERRRGPRWEEFAAATEHFRSSLPTDKVRQCVGASCTQPAVAIPR